MSSKTPPIMIWIFLACGFWGVGEPIPANERGPIMRAPEVAYARLPSVGHAEPNAELGCHAALAAFARLATRGADDDVVLPAMASLVTLGRTAGAGCARAVDEAVALKAERRSQHLASVRSHEYWMLAGAVATTRERADAAYRNAALYAWHVARLLVRFAVRDGEAFPLEPWIEAGDALAAASLETFAVDAYENALRASRARELTPARAAHIAHALERLPGDRAAALRARIVLGMCP